VWRVAWSMGGKNEAASMARGICVFFGKMRRPLPWRKQQGISGAQEQNSVLSMKVGCILEDARDGAGKPVQVTGKWRTSWMVATVAIGTSQPHGSWQGRPWRNR
jgi:hypothetical protein